MFCSKSGLFAPETDTKLSFYASLNVWCVQFLLKDGLRTCALESRVGGFLDFSSKERRGIFIGFYGDGFRCLWDWNRPVGALSIGCICPLHRTYLEESEYSFRNLILKELNQESAIVEESPEEWVSSFIWKDRVRRSVRKLTTEAQT